LSSITFAWFAPLLEHQSPLFKDFEALFEEFNATFGNLDKNYMSNIKIQFLCEGSPLVVVYASDFDNQLVIFHGVR
jgi:hypothetical protein